ncbi:MAG: hypothetical protein ACPGJV_02540 [Bacteriovoracaceae bacterium]
MQIRPLLASIILTSIIGVGSMVFSAFVSSPPTRAEFESFKVQTIEREKSTNRILLDLKKGQFKILDKMEKLK